MADVDTCQSPTESTPKDNSLDEPTTKYITEESTADKLTADLTNDSTELTSKNGNSIEASATKKSMTPTPEQEETPAIAIPSDSSDDAVKTTPTNETEEEDVEMSDVTTDKSGVEAKSNKTPIKQNGDINGEHEDVEMMDVDQLEKVESAVDESSTNGVENKEIVKDKEEAKNVEKPSDSAEPEKKLVKEAKDSTVSSKKPVELNDEEACKPENNQTKESVPDKPSSATSSPKKVVKPDEKSSNGIQEEESVVLDSDSEDEAMEVDGRTNGMDDDEKPVSIGSDTDDSESDLNTSQSNSRDVPTNDNSNDVQEILSDKEDDCVVIDDNKSQSPTGTRSTNRDDEDPLGAAHSQSSASSSPVSFSINKNDKASPSLVVVDTAKLLGKSQTQPANLQKTPTTTTTKNANLLPNLTDDMFVLEAPSFIVPYIYEKPPSTALKEVVSSMAKDVEEQLRKEAEERKKREESELGDREKAKKLLEEAAEKEKKKKKRQSSRRKDNDDDDWDDDEPDSSEDSDEEGEGVTRVLIKDVEDDLLAIKEHIITPDTIREAIIGGEGKKSDNFFESPLGKFFMGIGVNLVQEHVQTDLLRQQKRKRDKEGTNPSESTMMAINSLMKNLETSKENNAPFKFSLKRCEYCHFKSESALAMAHHYETPHIKNNVYRCNFCSYETKNTAEVMWHMEAMHNIKGRLEKPLSYHQCPNCTFEDNGRSKLARHSIACVKKFKPESNLSPALDWDPPAKIPKVKPKHGLVGTATAYQVSSNFSYFFTLQVSQDQRI